ncbi:unnamed protein product [Dicrocoelium dendriticum]|nr:unnamed protein product [Dicrocoelium dendriticum]
MSSTALFLISHLVPSTRTHLCLREWMNAITSLIQNRPYQPSAPQSVQSLPSYMPSAGVPGQIGFTGMPQPYDSAPPPPYGGYGSGQYGAPPMAPASQPAYCPGPSAYPQQPPPPPPGQAGYYHPPAAGQQFVSSNGQPYEVVYVEGKPKKKKLGGLKNAAVGLASGLAGGYLASRMFGGWGLGGGWGGGFGGLGRWGSWSSFSSFSWSD